MEHNDHITSIINKGNVIKDDIQYFVNVEYEGIDKNSLLQVFQFKLLMNILDIKVFSKIYYYLGILCIISQTYCKILIN